jgi:hypothetical protein
MKISNQFYARATKLSAIIAASCAFALGRVGGPFHSALMGIMICSALTSVFLMFFTTDSFNKEIAIAKPETKLDLSKELVTQGNLQNAYDNEVIAPLGNLCISQQSASLLIRL